MNPFSFRLPCAAVSGLFFTSIAIVPSVLTGQDQRTEGGGASRQSEAFQPSSFSSRTGPVETELIALQRAPFATPEAKQRAIREWHQSRGAALKTELAARHEMERPERERLEAENRAQHEKFLDDQVANGKIGAKEAQFIKLLRKSYTSAAQRRSAIEGWRGLHGAAMDAEREQRRAAEAPQLAALQADLLAQRRQQIGEALQHGRIGPREAELMRILFDPHIDPPARHHAVRDWMEKHGSELRAEQAARWQRNVDDPAPAVISSP